MKINELRERLKKHLDGLVEKYQSILKDLGEYEPISRGVPVRFIKLTRNSKVPHNKVTNIGNFIRSQYFAQNGKVYSIEVKVIYDPSGGEK